MKPFLFTAFVLLFYTSMLSQHQGMNTTLKYHLAENRQSDLEYTLLVKGNTPALQQAQKHFGFRFNYAAGDVASITCPLKVVGALFESQLVRHAELVQNRLKTFNDTMLVRNRIKAVKQGAAPLNMPYNGEGVIMGIIDTGTDFNHADFKDSLGNTRIRFLWDQVPSSGSSVPQPYGYGIEWTASQINAAQCTHSDVAYYGHGTAVAGIAAGNGLASGKHEASASKSDLIVVAVDFNNSNTPVIADAVQYIFDKATQLGKPCVINASLGDYYGSHDGTDLQTQAIEFNLKNIPGRALVSAVGNAGGYKYHVKTQTQTGDTAFTWLRNSGTQIDYWFYGDSLQVKNLYVNVGANRANFSNLGSIGFKPYQYGLTSLQSDTLFHNGHRIAIIKNTSSINSAGVYELYLRIVADTSNLYWRVETAGPGEHQAWNFDFVSSALPNSTQYPLITRYVMPDTISTLVSGFQCSDEVTTVGAFLNMSRYYDVHDSLRNNGGVAGTFSPFSSVGPTRDGRIKPDLCASGNFIFTAMVMSMQSALIANTPTSVAQDSVHVLGGGTSAASPVVAGLAALYLQRHPSATSADVRTALTSCAYQDVFTGTATPNPVWGYGKLDGLATMTCGEVLTSISEKEQVPSVHAYPNPFSQSTRILCTDAAATDVFIYSLDWRLLFSERINTNTYELNASSLPAGLLVARLVTSEGVHLLKLLKE